MKKFNDQESLMQTIKKFRLYSSLTVTAFCIWAGVLLILILDHDLDKIALIILLTLSIVFGIVFYILIGKDLSEIINYSKKNRISLQ